ncbi:MAG: NAD(+) synthase [Eggerthellaceae bacterium]|nr:NAD(+) synthase [Eggerthellaceae bacterium]
MADLSKLKVALCQIEAVQGHPSSYELALHNLVERVKLTGADLAVFPAPQRGEQPRLVAMNGSVLLQEEARATLSAQGELFHIALGDGPNDARDDCDFAIVSDWTPWTLAGAEPQLPAGMPCIQTNPIGIENHDKRIVAFDGASKAVLNDGTVVARLRDDFTGDYTPFTFAGGGRIADACDMKALRAIVSSIRRFDAFALSWHPKWVIGLSGGLDSSVVAALLVMALGPNRVIGYNLATRYNSDATKANAASLAEALGIELRNGSIEQLVKATGDTLSQYGYPDDAMSGLVLENVQARLRGHALSTFSAIEGGVVANNGNRIEAALGYATLYGDAIGALAPIGDLTKVQLFDLSRQINEVFEKEIVPENLLPIETEDGFIWETMPSAELADGQRDPMKWFYHDWLVTQLLDETACDPCPIMQGYLDDRLASTPVAKWLEYYGLADDPAAFMEDLEWVTRSMRTAAFKRIQAPPAIRIASPASIASAPEWQGTLEPSTRYEELKRAILG